MRLPARLLVSPAGALIALVCFFLPWYDMGCDGRVHTTYGYEMGWPFWIVPVAAAGMLAAFGVAVACRKYRGARIAIRVLSIALPVLVGLVIFIVIDENVEVGLRPVTPADVDYYRLRYGILGSAAGLAIAFLGAGFLTEPPSASQNRRRS